MDGRTDHSSISQGGRTGNSRSVYSATVDKESDVLALSWSDLLEVESIHRSSQVS